MNKKHKRKSKKKKYYKIFGTKVNERTFAAIIAAIFFGLLFLSIFLYRDMVFSKGGEYVIAKIDDMRYMRSGGIKSQGKRLYMIYKYHFNGKEYRSRIRIWEDDREIFHIGDCIKIYVAKENPNIYRWNKSQGTVRCPIEKKPLLNFSEP